MIGTYERDPSLNGEQFFAPEEPVVLPYPEEVLEAAVVDPQDSLSLLQEHPDAWFRSAIAVGSGKKPSEVTDREMVDRLIDGGLDGWDPTLKQPIVSFLQERGFFIFN